MTLKLIATEGDTHTQECYVHCPLCPCTNAGTYTIPSNLQDFVYISNNLVVLDQQSYSACCTATCNASTALLFIGGVAAVRDGDSVSSNHSNTGVDVGNQSFVYSE